MKEMLFISPLDNTNASSGLSKKINMQINFFKNNDINVELVNIKREDTLFTKVWSRLPYTGMYLWNKYISDEKLKKTDYIYIRYHSADYQLVRLLKRSKKLNKNIKVFIEIPTYPYGNENKATVKRKLHIIKDKINRQKINFFTDRIITFSDDEKIFDIPTIRISNAIDFNKVNVREPKNNPQRDETIKFVAVASLYFWHGYDRLIEGINNYIQSGKRKFKVEFHLVGGGPELTKYKTLVKKYELEESIVFHGALHGQKLDEIYNNSDLAFDSLGRHRSGVYYNSSLKGKEYGAKGLPIISGVKTELDNFPDYPYYWSIPADDSPIDVDKIISQYEKIIENKTQEQITKEIRMFNEKHFDVNVVWNEVIDMYENMEKVK